MTKYDKKKRNEIMEHFKNWIEIQKIFNNREEIARYLHISKPHLNNLVAGRRNASDTLLNKIAIMTEFGKLSIKNSFNPSDEKVPYMDLAQELRNWLSKQDRYSSQKELADYLEMPYGTLQNYFLGRYIPKGELRKKLYNITHIEMIKPEEKKPKKSTKPRYKASNKVSSLENRLKEISNASKTIQLEVDTLKREINKNKKLFESLNGISNSYDRFALAFYTLAEELIVFRDSNTREREELRRRISPKDVGYVVSFLKALYDDDKFSDFIFFTKYEFEMMER